MQRLEFRLILSYLGLSFFYWIDSWFRSNLQKCSSRIRKTQSRSSLKNGDLKNEQEIVKKYDDGYLPSRKSNTFEICLINLFYLYLLQFLVIRSSLKYSFRIIFDVFLAKRRYV